MSDPTGHVLSTLLGHVIGRLDGGDASVCRSFVAPGTVAPWDTCCDCTGGEGQAWTLAERVYPTQPFPQQDTGAQRCRPVQYAAEVVVGVLRCAVTVDDHGNPPLAQAVTADADKVSRDRDLMLAALLCDWLGDDDDPGTFRLGEWTPLGPQGGCVGGQWRATVALPALRCD